MHIISKADISLGDIQTALHSGKMELSVESTAYIQRCREYLDKKLEGSTTPFYGINTGFGALYNKSVSTDDLGKLQLNLVMSHACGMGEQVPDEIVRLMLLLKIKGLSYGHSGVQVQTVRLLIEFFNRDILPVIYEQGSLGASGDLAPLAHLSLPLCGMGEVKWKGKIVAASEVLKEEGLQPVSLQSKEGLALLNGTQFMSSYGIWALIKSKQLAVIADVIAALSLDAFDGRIEPFHASVHEIRPHNGQIITAAHIRGLLQGSEIISRTKKHVQDPYAFRCIPQVHGATKDTLDYAQKVLFTEVNAITDNPTIFPDEDLIISAGNFHGQPLALVLDFMAIAMAELGSISERRTYQLIGGLRDLPPFLTADPGLDSGFMIPQYTAASIVSQNKQLCTPASVDSIVSSNGQEDHVSMGANAATKLYRVVNNVEKILAIELMNAMQAIEFRRPLKTSPRLESLISSYREKVSFMQNDRILYTDMKDSVTFIQQYNFDNLISSI